MAATPVGYRGIVGKRLGLLGNGMLSVDGKVLKGAIPTLGKDIFVDSVTGNDNSDGLTPDRALATLDAAFAQTVANKGYQIFVLPLHAETITGAAGIAHDVAGVSVIGLGHGGQRPTFLMDASSAVTYKITANDGVVSNLKFNGGDNGIVTCFDVQTATDVWLDQLEFGDNATDEHFLTCIKSGTTTDNQCDGLRITNSKWFSVDAGSLEFYEMLGDTDRLWIEGNHVQTAGTASPLMLCTAGDDVQNLVFLWNYIQNKMTANDLMIDNDQADNTGIVAHNRCGNRDVTGAQIMIDCDGVDLFDNLATSTATTSGGIVPVADTPAS